MKIKFAQSSWGRAWALTISCCRGVSTVEPSKSIRAPPLTLGPTKYTCEAKTASLVRFVRDAVEMRLKDALPQRALKTKILKG